MCIGEGSLPVENDSVVSLDEGGQVLPYSVHL